MGKAGRGHGRAGHGGGPKYGGEHKVTGYAKAILNDNSRRRAQQTEANLAHRALGVSEKQAGRSVLEQGSLETFLADAELARATFESVRGEAYPRDEGARLISTGPVNVASMEERAAAAKQVKVPIPWRPEWHEDMDAEEL